MEVMAPSQHHQDAQFYVFVVETLYYHRLDSQIVGAEAIVGVEAYEDV